MEKLPEVLMDYAGYIAFSIGIAWACGSAVLAESVNRSNSKSALEEDMI